MESVTLSFIGEISPGRGVLGAAHLSEGSSPELLLTFHVRKSWDTLHSTEARCFSPSLLAREQAKKLITNQQWLLAPSMANRHCVLCHFTLCLVCGPSQVSLEGQDLSSECVSSLHQVPSGTQKTVFCLRKVLISKSLPLLGFEHCSELCVRVRYNLGLCSYGKQRLHTPVTAGLS